MRTSILLVAITMPVIVLTTVGVSAIALGTGEPAGSLSVLVDGADRPPTSRSARVPGAVLADEACAGSQVVPGSLFLARDGEGVALTLDGESIGPGEHPLPAGTYTLAWRAVPGYHLDAPDTSLRVVVGAAACTA